ncbi:MAG: sigma-54-dependent Fis family transcriptional regulator [Polyangiaceae bacterium]|nr:sigma-54-dependent Fis family transcriptional regulator [Polyangiaceae bacterium]
MESPLDSIDDRTSVRANPTTIEINSSVPTDRDDAGPVAPALVIAWCAEEPARVGEAAIFEMEGSARVLGRGAEDSQGAGRVMFGRQRPGERPRGRQVSGSGISREQLRITPKGDRLFVERLGKCATLFRGAKVDKCTLAPGDTLLLKGQLLLLCVLRPLMIAGLRDFQASLLGAFGAPCALGILGESPAIHALRDTVAFHAKAGAHALVLGPSGAGKELLARGIHRLSARDSGPFVARNAATIPVGLAEAELFGNVKNYPNPGMAERPGLIGAADGGTLFLDEIGDLPEALHASLLRVLDGDGEYHRLGEAKARRANVRLVGATNRPPEALKHDLLARLPLRIQVPGLNARREDIPLLVRHLLHKAHERSPELVQRFTGSNGEIAVSSDLVSYLLHRQYTTHVRELDGLLWRAMAGSRGARIDLPEEMEHETFPPSNEAGPAAQVTQVAETRAPAVRRKPEEEPTPDEIRAAIDASGGNFAQAAKALHLPSRYALYRLLRKNGIDVDAIREEGE